MCLRESLPCLWRLEQMLRPGHGAILLFFGCILQSSVGHAKITEESFKGLKVECQSGENHFITKFTMDQPTGRAWILNNTPNDAYSIEGSVFNFTKSGKKSHASVAWIEEGVTIDFSDSGA